MTPSRCRGSCISLCATARGPVNLSLVGVARSVPLYPIGRADCGTSGHQGIPRAGSADSDRGGPRPEASGMPFLWFDRRRAGARTLQRRRCPGRAGHASLQGLQPHCRVHPPHAQSLISPRSAATALGFRFWLLLASLRRRKQPAPPNRREKRQRPPAARVVAEVDHQWLSPNILTGEKTPVSAVV